MNKVHYIDNQAFERVNRKMMEIQLIRCEILKSTMGYFIQHGFALIDPPILHEYISSKKPDLYFEFDGRLFELNASNALYMGAYASMLDRVFAISPTFRKENISDNHLTEFRILEVELMNCPFSACIELVRDYLTSILRDLCNMEIRTMFSERFNELYNNFQIGLQSYGDIIKKLKLSGCDIEYGADLSDYDDKVSGIIKNPTFVIDYPFPVASWTALPKDCNIANAFNLILPDQYGELAEGCQRNNNYKVFEYKFKKAGIESLGWYINAIKGCDSDRSGFGMGIDRLVRWVVGCESLADTVLFPRFSDKG